MQAADGTTGGDTPVSVVTFLAPETKQSTAEV